MPKKKNKLATYIGEEFKILSDGLNKKSQVYVELMKFHQKHGYVPFEYKQTWEHFLNREGGKLWFENKAYVKKIKAAAKIQALRRLKNEKTNKDNK